MLPSASPRLGDDWLYREIDWWIRKRGTSPFLIQAPSKISYVPLEIQNKWPRANWLELDLDALGALSETERNERAEEIVGRILEGIARSRSGIVYEELERQKRLGFRFLVSAIVAGVLAVAAGGLGFWANYARQVAKAETKRADDAARLAEARAKIAESRRIAALSDAERGKRLDLSLMFAVEAQNVLEKLEEQESLSPRDKLEARNSLFRSLQDRPRILSILSLADVESTTAAISPKGGIIAAGYNKGDSGGVVLFDALQRTRLWDERLNVAKAQVTSVAFSPDGQTLAVGYKVDGIDFVVGLVELRQWTQLQADPLKVTVGRAKGLAFSPDGKILAAVYGDIAEGVHFLDVDLKSWKHKAGEVANRNFTPRNGGSIFRTTRIARHSTGCRRPPKKSRPGPLPPGEDAIGFKMIPRRL